MGRSAVPGDDAVSARYVNSGCSQWDGRGLTQDSQVSAPVHEKL